MRLTIIRGSLVFVFPLIFSIYAQKSPLTINDAERIISQTPHNSNLYVAVGSGDNPSFNTDIQSSRLGMILCMPSKNNAALDYSVIRNKNVPQVLAAGYGSWDGIYKDLRTVWHDSGPGVLAGSPLSKAVINQKATTPHKNRFLAIKQMGHLRDFLSKHPDFFNYFDGVTVDALQIAKLDSTQCANEKSWLTDHDMLIIADLRRHINTWPELTFANYAVTEQGIHNHYVYSFTIYTMLLNRMQAIGCAGILIQSEQNGDTGITGFCRLAAARNITVFIQKSPAPNRPDPATLISSISNARSVINLNYDGQSLSNVPSKLGCIIIGSSGLTARNAVNGSSSWSGTAPQPVSMNPPANLQLLGAFTAPLILDGGYTANTSWSTVLADVASVGWK